MERAERKLEAVTWAYIGGDKVLIRRLLHERWRLRGDRKKVKGEEREMSSSSNPLSLTVFLFFVI